MSLILAPAAVTQPESTVRGRILVIEPNAARAMRLADLVRSRIQADLKVARSASDALRKIEEAVPDLVLTSTFLAPAEAESLNTQLRQMPAAAHVQVITVPHFIDDEAAPVDGPAHKVLSFLSRSSRPDAPACDPSTLVDDIAAYLDQSLVMRETLSVERTAMTALVATPGGDLAAFPAECYQRAGQARADDRRRARRRPIAELPWLWAAKLPWGTEVKVIDLSNRGVLVESPSKLAAGTTFDLQMLGQGTTLYVPARAVRSEVAGVDGLGVRYRVAAAFAQDLDIPGLGSQYPAAALTPRSLGELLSRVMGEVDRFATPDAVRARFEQELRELLPLRDAQIRKTPVIASQETESIFFTVPTGSGASPILQATFDPNYRPSPLEYRLLKAAASLAAVVLEFAPFEESEQTALPS